MHISKPSSPFFESWLPSELVQYIKYYHAICKLYIIIQYIHWPRFICVFFCSFSVGYVISQKLSHKYIIDRLNNVKKCINYFIITKRNTCTLICQTSQNIFESSWSSVDNWTWCIYIVCNNCCCWYQSSSCTIYLCRIRP